ncbi:MAG: nucleotidyl transferase AbiEii/AbiGii toxin family protein [Anaerolineae bacterium]|nr:nucleotidyl transferase AbiEii/AbiGii toxin family protein [Anaerolineae bacterium]
MPHKQESVSHDKWLTPLQLAVLEQFFATEAGKRFFLTGGTALAAFHLHHRLSVDLDLFTLDDLALREAGLLRTCSPKHARKTLACSPSIWPERCFRSAACTFFPRRPLRLPLPSYRLLSPLWPIGYWTSCAHHASAIRSIGPCPRLAPPARSGTSHRVSCTC